MRFKLNCISIVGIIVVFLGSCDTEIKRYIPEKHADLSQGEYDNYLSMLNEAYDSGNNFKASFQLANLKADTEMTFELLTKSLKENPTGCEKVYDYYFMYDRHNFSMNLVKLDTSKFKEAVALCDLLNDETSYLRYAEIKDKEDEEARKNKEKEDSTNFNIELVRELEQISFNDQEIRKKANAKNITPELIEELSEEMKIIDSINLIRIDGIFKQYGYPSRELVGKECNFTPALVIHHIDDLETRYKYLPFLEKAVNDGLLNEGALNMIKIRNEHMELEKK